MLALFVGRNLIQSSYYYTPKEILFKPIDELGSFNITQSGDLYFNLLLKKQWYFIAIMRNTLFHSKYISYDSEKDHQYITHRNFIDFFEEAEEKECEYRDKSIKSIFQFTYPSQLAKTALFQYKNPEQTIEVWDGM